MKSKWLFTSLFFLAFCMSAYGIQVSAPDLEAQPGDAITVEVSVDDATGIAGADFSLVYDPAILTASDARLTELGTGLIPSDPNLTVAGQVTMAIMGLQGIAEGSGAFIEVDFDVLPDASGVSPLDLSGIALYDELGGDLPVEVVNGSVTVLGVKGTGEVLLHHLEAIGAGDVDEIMADYAEDAALLTPDGALSGHEEIRPLFEGMLADVLPPGSPFLVAQQIIEGEIAYIVWSAESDNYDIPFGSDTFIVRDGSITTQSFASRMLPKVGEPAPPPTLLELPESPEKDVLMHHLDAIGAGDVDAIMADYAEDAILITPDGVLRGLAEIRPLFEGMVADILPPGSPFLMIQQIIEGEVAYIVWSAESESYNIHLGTDTFIIRDGKIVTQTFAAQMEAKPPVVDTEANKAIVVREFEEVWNQQNLDVIDEIYSPDNVFHDPAETGFMGREGYRQFVTMYITAFPDVQFTIEEQIALGDKVATQWSATGTHQGELMGIPPTDMYAITTGINIAQIVDGQIVEEWAHWDALGQMQQLGVITPGRPAPENYMWGAPSGVVGEAGDPDANKAVVMRSIEEVWNQGNLDVMDEISSPDHVGHSPVELTSPMIGIEAAKAGIAVYLAAFPDLELTVEDIFAAGDMVVARWSSTGTHEGELAGIPPTGKETESTGILMSRVVDGLITDSWWAWDALGLIQQITPPEVPVTEANKALELRIFEEIWNQGAVDVIDEILAEDYVIHDPAGEFAGPEGYKQFQAIFYNAFPDVHFTIEDQTAEDDMVVTRWTSTATHTGELMGTPATGVAIVTTGITISQIIDGKVVEEWNSWDILGLMQQIGAIDPAGRDDFLWGEPSVVTGAPGDLEANKALAARYTEEVWNQQNMDAADEIFISDVINHEPVSRPIADILGIPRDVGLEGHKAGIGVYLTAFPDIHGVIDDMIAEGDKVVVRWTATGTHQGEFMGLPPTEKQVTWTGNTMYRFADDKVVEMWWAWDALGLMQQITPPAVPETEANKALERRVFEEIWNQGNLDLADELAAPDVVVRTPPNPDTVGVEAFKAMVAMYRTSFPDVQWTIEDMMAEGDLVVTRLTGTGTHQADFMGIPATGVQMTATMISIVRIADGKIQESWNFADMLGVMQQLGVISPPREAYDWGAPSEVTGAAGDPEENKTIVAEFIEELWNQKNLDALLWDTYSPDFASHVPVEPINPLVGIDANREAVSLYITAFPDLVVTNEVVVAEGDKVVVRWTTNATHGGELMGLPPSGKSVTFTGVTIYRLADGVQVENWWAWDTLGLVQQITPTEPEPTLPEAILAMLAVSDGAINSQDPELLVSFSADDQVFDYVPTPPPIEGKEAMKEYFTEVFQTFPDLSVTLIRPPLVAGNIAVVEHIMAGTQLGDLDLGPAGKVPPTGESFQNTHMDVWEFEGDKSKRITTYDDTAGQLMQLGIMPAAELPELVPSFTLPDPEPTGLASLEAYAEQTARWNSLDLSHWVKMIHRDADLSIGALGIPMDRDAYIAAQELYLLAFPDRKQENISVVDLGDGWMLAEIVFTGTNDGPYFGVPATGLPISVRAGQVSHFDADGLLTYQHTYFDNLTILMQLGLFPPPTKPPLPEVLPVGHHKLDMVYESVQDFASAPEERPDGLYLVSTQEAIFDAREVILTFDDGTVLELTGMSRGEHQELKVVFDDAGVPVNAVGASYGTLEIFGPQDEVLFRGAYTAEDEATLSPEFQALGFSSKFKSAALGQNAYDGHTCTATVEGNMVPDPDDPEKLILLATGDAVLDKIITTKPPTGSHTTEASFRYTQDYGLVPDQREDGLYLVSTRQAIAVCDEFTYVFDTGEVLTGNVVASGERQELEVIFDENGVPVKAVGTSYGVTMKGIDSYGNTREGVMSMKVSVDLSPDMQPVGMTAEMACLAQLKGKFGNYIATDYLVATPEPDPEDPTKVVYHGVGTGEMTEVTGLSSVGIHSMQLQAGLNMVSVPMKPLEDYTARSLAEELGATVVIRYDKETNSFVGFTPEMPGDGYAIEAGVGYIVNVLKPLEVEFMGTIWGNVSLPEVQAAPPSRMSAWAFVVSGSVLEGEGMSVEDGGYMLTAKNLRTGATAIEKVDTSGYFAAIWADLSRKAVAEAGDKVEVAVIDSSGKVVSGPFVHDITLDGIRNAVVKVQMRLGDIIPEKSALLQNYPNPFNPETWIPFHLKGEAPVSIRIFNLSGQLIKTLDLGHRDAGVYVSRTKAAYWDGKNEAGEEVSSGIYFYSISAGDLSATRKMIIRK